MADKKLTVDQLAKINARLKKRLERKAAKPTTRSAIPGRTKPAPTPEKTTKKDA